jgi:hypothetical protein
MPRAEQPTVDQLATLVRARASEESPGARLGVAIEISEASDALIERFVAEARAAGMSWTEIGQVFGTSKQAAQKRYGATRTPKGGSVAGALGTGRSARA